jgi:hypothetical protein
MMDFLLFILIRFLRIPFFINIHIIFSHSLPYSLFSFPTATTLPILNFPLKQISGDRFLQAFVSFLLFFLGHQFYYFYLLGRYRHTDVFIWLEVAVFGVSDYYYVLYSTPLVFVLARDGWWLDATTFLQWVIIFVSFIWGILLSDIFVLPLLNSILHRAIF